MNDIVHLPWVGNQYKSGINGKRIAIVGYSHWKGNDDPDEDNEDVTKVVLDKVLEGKYSNITFYNKIQSYFGRESVDFWNNVLFFNFIPNYIGLAEKRHAEGSDAQVEIGKQRFYDILQKYQPHSVFIFSRKAWESLPPTIEEAAGIRGDAIPGGQPNFERHHYLINDQFVQAMALRHTQGASDALMHPAVAGAMALTPLPDEQLRALLP